MGNTNTDVNAIRKRTTDTLETLCDGLDIDTVRRLVRTEMACDELLGKSPHDGMGLDKEFNEQLDDFVAEYLNASVSNQAAALEDPDIFEFSLNGAEHALYSHGIPAELVGEMVDSDKVRFRIVCDDPSRSKHEVRVVLKDGARSLDEALVNQTVMEVREMVRRFFRGN